MWIQFMFWSYGHGVWDEIVHNACKQETKFSSLWQQGPMLVILVWSIPILYGFRDIMIAFGRSMGSQFFVGIKRGKIFSRTARAKVTQVSIVSHEPLILGWTVMTYFILSALEIKRWKLTVYQQTTYMLILLILCMCNRLSMVMKASCLLLSVK